MRHQVVEELQEDFNIKSYDFYAFFHDGKICLSPKVGLDLSSFFVPFNYKNYIVYIC